MRLPEKLRVNLFILLVGVVYIFSLSGMNIGDLYFRSLENGYPLFIKNIFGKYPLWYGFQKAHFLNIPTLRAIQLTFAKIGFLPNPLILVQLVNLCLALITLKLLFSFFSRLGLGGIHSKITVILIAFSFGFWANLNGEVHHFSILLFVVNLWLLFDIESKPKVSGYSVFIFCLCLVLMPLYHLECVLFTALFVFYVLLNRNLRLKFRHKLPSVFLGTIVLPAIISFCAILFYYLNNYFDFGKPAFTSFVADILPKTMRAQSEKNFASQIFNPQNYNFSNIYIMLRAQLESLSILSRTAKIIQHYRDIAFYAGSFPSGLSAIAAIIFTGIFSLVNIMALISIVRLRRTIPSFMRLLIVMLFFYLSTFGVFLSSDNLLSEFFIISALIHVIILGYFLHKAAVWQRVIYYVFVLFVSVSNVFYYFIPQKISSGSITKILDVIERKDRVSQRINVFRLGFLNLPYESGLRGRLKIFTDEHAYESKENTAAYLSLIEKGLETENRVYLIAPGFLFGDEKEVNVNSIIPVSFENSVWLENMKYLLAGIKQKYSLSVSKDFRYNFGTLGQLGRIAVVEVSRRGS